MAATARTSKARQRTPFLPPQVQARLTRFGWRMAGLVVFAVGVLLTVAVVGYAPTDPSLNTAAPGQVLNPLGLPGAVIADLAIQTLGLAAIAPILALIGWGGRVTLGRPVGWLWLRIMSMIAAALLIAMGLTALPYPETWALPAGLGGFSGTLLVAHAQRLLTVAGVAQDLRWVIAGSAGILGVVLLFWAVAVRLAEWRAMGTGIGAGARMASGGAGRMAEVATRLPRVGRLRQSDDRDVVSPAAPTLRARQADAEAPAVRREPVMGSRPPAPVVTPAAPAPLREPGLVAAPPPRPPSKREMESRQGSLLPDDDGTFRLPPLDLLGLSTTTGTAHLDEDALSQNARLLEGVLGDFGVNGAIVKVRPGPVVTLYELEPAPGTKTSRVVGLADDIARSMSAVSVRIAVVPGQSTIGIELPNARREMVNFRELLAADDFHKAQGSLTLALGRDIGGAPVYVDLTRMPHLLIAGTTGSGKSVGINTMICSLLYRMKPEECRFIMIDPKMLELSVYDGIPHLLTPVVTDPGKAVVALKWAVKEMENRYRAMSQMGVRNIAGYNQRLRDAVAKGQHLTRTVQTGFDPETGKPIYEEQDLEMTPLPFIVVIVDEMADLMLVAGKDVEAAIQRLAQMARAAGIHLVMATQRPSVDVITGTIKANFPTRISFQVTSKIDSRTILGEQGAEQLLGQGDMLYMAAGGRITRVHGPFVSDTEVEAIAGQLRAQAQPDYLTAVTDEDEQGPSAVLDALTGGGSGGGDNSGDELFDQAIALVARERKASTSFVQRHLQIGYNRAARIIERMEAEGMVGKPNHVGKREVLLPPMAEDY